MTFCLDSKYKNLIWQPEKSLPKRVLNLRNEYFSFRERSNYYTNEVRSYTTGKIWDVVYSPHNWGVVPEIMPFFHSCFDSLLALAEKMELPEDFFRKPLIIRKAISFKLMIEKYLPVKILDGELIVGSHFNTAPTRCFTKQESKVWKKLENKYLKELKECNDLGVGNCGAIPGHLIPDYPKVLKMGFCGIRDEIQKKLKKVVKSEQRNFLEALTICCDAVKNFAFRYSNLADEMASSEIDDNRRRELYKISEICRKVPWEPSTTFYEALQSLWFTHMLVMAAEGYPGAGLSYGRIDQYLYNFYRDDLNKGEIDREFARELLCCFWIKHNYAYDYQGKVGNNQGINSGFGQLITIGGIDEDGNDSSNELSWLILEVIEQMNMLEPKPNIRIHRNTPDPLLLRVAQLLSKAQGSPFIMNFDEASMAGLEWQGLPKERLWDYAPVGCLENTLQGDDRSGTVDVNLNIAKAVELVLFNGKDLSTGKRIGPQTGDPCKFKDFNEFYVAYKIQLKSIINKLISVNNLADLIRAKLEPTPYLSLLVGGCIEKCKDITSAGANYNFITVEGIAFATAVDSLLAVKSLIFEQKRISMQEMIDAIKNNYSGFEKIQRMLLNRAPKYGNDSEADEMAFELNKFWTNEVFKMYSPTGKRYRGGYLSWNYWISYAPMTAATPDGRMQGRFLSNGIGPVNGMDRCGPTALIRSVGKVGLKTAPNGASHTMSFSPSLLRDSEHVHKLASLLKAYAYEGGTALQINVINADMLREAQKQPEHYRNLLVRVTGYNAYFVTLGKEIQDEIIAREAHELG